MKRIFLTGLFASLIAVACFAQKPYKVVFYNFENLFDTIHDPGVLDEEFTPEGPKKRHQRFFCLTSMISISKARSREAVPEVIKV